MFVALLSQGNRFFRVPKVPKSIFPSKRASQKKTGNGKEWNSGRITEVLTGTDSVS